MMNPSPTTEERTWAVVSHLSALAFGMGLPLTIVGWSEQRDRSRYASFQCLQALGYQSLGYTVWLVSYIVLAILLVVVFAVAAPSMGNDSSDILPWVIVFLFFIFGIFGAYMLFPVIGAIACVSGRDFHYPVIGKRLARYLGYGLPGEAGGSATLNGEHEDRWVAAMGHFSVIIPLWGILAPAATWLLPGRQNAYLKFQSVQTTIYQAVVNIFYLGAMLLSFLSTIPVFALTGLEAAPGPTPPTAILGLLLFLLFMLIAFGILLVLPLFHILGQWAGYRVLKGDNYRYPIVGKLVEKRLANRRHGVRALAPESDGKPLDSTEEAS